MQESVLLGDEALALGAIHAGLSSAYGYPGTPSTEILEYILKRSESQGSPVVSWCSNEKTAYEAALGVSLVGRRALVTMKHVGLNVALDPFINSSLLDIGGGLVLAVADDPGMHSSQDEQDSRYLADFAKVITFEPANQQEAYDMARESFDISERFKVPVVIRLVTRLAHSRAVVRTGEQRAENPVKKAENTAGWMLLPAMARKNWAALLARQKDFKAYTEASPFNPLAEGRTADYGVITTGIGRNYYNENASDLPVKPPHLHIGVYPIPAEKLRNLASGVKRLVLIEEGYPFVEEKLTGILPQTMVIEGKLSGLLPLTGELTPDSVRKALKLPEKAGQSLSGFTLPGRPPQLCAGCPHRDSFDAITLAVSGYEKSLVTSDIGCYALGALPPYKAIETIVCMGASIGMARGAREAGFHPVVATIGDSTFLHSGITALVDAVARKTQITVVILDNSIVAMTGGQDTMIGSDDFVRLLEGIGVERGHIRILKPLKKHTEENAAIIREEIEYPGVSVILSQRECIAHAVKMKKQGGAA